MNGVIGFQAVKPRIGYRNETFLVWNRVLCTKESGQCINIIVEDKVLYSGFHNRNQKLKVRISQEENYNCMEKIVNLEYGRGLVPSLE